MAGSEDESLYQYHIGPIIIGIIIGIVSVVIVRRLRWYASSSHRRPSHPASKARPKTRRLAEEQLELASRICLHPQLARTFQSAGLSAENQRRAQVLDKAMPLKKSILQWLKAERSVEPNLTMRSTLQEVLTEVRGDAPFRDCPEACAMLCLLCQRARFGHEQFTEDLLRKFRRNMDIVLSRWRAHLDRSAPYAVTSEDNIDGSRDASLSSPVSPAGTRAVAFSSPSATSNTALVLETAI